MRSPDQAEIAFLAHRLWEQQGRPQGRELEHWLHAEQQLADCAPTPTGNEDPDSHLSSSGRQAAARASPR